MAAEVTVTLAAHGVEGRSWIKATAWGTVQGRYQSLAVMDVRTDEHAIPTDPEELVSLLLTCLHGLVYHT